MQWPLWPGYELLVLFCLSFRSGTVLPAHAVEGLREDLRRHAVFVLQDQALLQRHRHGGAVFGALTAGEADAVQPTADLEHGGRGNSVFTKRGLVLGLNVAVMMLPPHLGCLPQDVHVLVLPGVDVLAQKPQQLRETSLGARPRQTWM